MAPGHQLTLIVLCAIVSLSDGWNLGPISPIWNQLSKSLSSVSNTISSAKTIFNRLYVTLKCYPMPEILGKIVISRVRLYYFYGRSRNDRVVVSLNKARRLLNNSYWLKDRPMAVFTYGWMNSPTSYYTKQIINAYITNGSYNLIVVDWALAGSWFAYAWAVSMVPQVGKAVAKALQQMLDEGATLDHLVGHSLGAHVAGHMGRSLKKRPSLVVGLDPAGPLFYRTMYKCQDPIKSTDGEYVVVLHTDWNRLGSNELTGPADFMPSGGHRIQPGCGLLDFDAGGGACSHYRAVRYWAAAIVDEDSIYGRLCTSYESFLDKQCENRSISKLVAPNRDLQGVFYFTTNAKSPYGKGLKGV